MCISVIIIIIIIIIIHKLFLHGNCFIAVYVAYYLLLFYYKCQYMYFCSSPNE